MLLLCTSLGKAKVMLKNLAILPDFTKCKYPSIKPNKSGYSVLQVLEQQQRVFHRLLNSHQTPNKSIKYSDQGQETENQVPDEF